MTHPSASLCFFSLATDPTSTVLPMAFRSRTWPLYLWASHNDVWWQYDQVPGSNHCPIYLYIYNMSQSYPIIISLISSNFSSFICTKEELDSLTVYYTGFPKMREPFSPCIGLYCFTNSILANLRAHFGVSQNKKLALGGPWRYGSKWG